MNTLEWKKNFAFSFTLLENKQGQNKGEGGGVVFYVDQLAHLLVWLCWETMAAKNFDFRENWVGSKVTGMKTFFCHFWSNLDPHFGTKNTLIRNYLNSILVKKDKNYILINFVTLRLTNQSGILENNQFFCHFWPKSDKNLALTSFKCDTSSYTWLKFPLRCLYNH